MMEVLGVGRTGSTALVERETASVEGHAHHGHELHEGGGGNRRESLRKIGRFALHAVEMCVAMCLGMMLLGPLFVAIAGWAGVPDPYRQVPELSAVVVATNMSLPMAAWMRLRGMDWRPIGEMTAAMFVEAALLVVMMSIGWISSVSLIPLQHTLMMPAMLVPMLLRLDLYTSGHAHHRAHAG